ncbi:short chain dehydrogenase [compost metagenome]
MNKVKKIIITISIAILILCLLVLYFPTWTPKLTGQNSIHVLEQVKINGVSQEIMIRGSDLNNPVVIYVHGGPGVSEIPHAKKLQDLLETTFTMVNYDQRGSGKSYHFFQDYSSLSSDLLVEDLLALTDYITERLGKKKVILIGHSRDVYCYSCCATSA